MVRRPRDAIRPMLPAPQEALAMIPRWLRRPLLWSPIAAMAAQLALVAVAAACTGGADFPLRR